MPRTASAVTSTRRRLAGNRGRGDADVARRDGLGHQLALLAVELFVQLLRVAARPFGVAGVERHLDELRAEAFDLLLHRRPHVVACTTAPSRLAEAIACRPATPAPITNTLAGVSVPAAVIIIGNILGKRSAASSTAL